MIASVFNSETGRVVKVVSCPVDHVSIQCGELEDWIEGHYPDDQFYIENFAPIPIPVQPSPHHVFDYTTKQWIDPRTPETEWPLVRTERDRRLLASDWTQLPDVPLATKEAWAAYRQALRDITEQPDPFNITWPAPPK